MEKANGRDRITLAENVVFTLKPSKFKHTFFFSFSYCGIVYSRATIIIIIIYLYDCGQNK